MLHRPVRPAAANAENKILQYLAAEHRVRHFGMKLHAEKAPRRIGKGGDRRIPAVRKHVPPRRGGHHFVAVAHPYFRGTSLRKPMKQIGVVVDGKIRGTVLAPVGPACFTAKGDIDKTHAITNPEKRHRQLKQLALDSRRVLLIDARRTAGEDDSFRPQRRDFVQGQIEWMDFAVDFCFSNAPGDELGILRTEVKNEDHSAR